MIKFNKMIIACDGESASGKSTVLNIEQIDRGYENIDERLKALGASIERI